MSSLKMAMGVSLLASVPALATPYEWNGADGTMTLGDVTVEKSGGVASLTGSNASWTYSDPSSFDSLTGVDLISATTLSSLTVADGVDFKARAGTLDQGEGALPATNAVNHARAMFEASQEHPIVSSTTFSGEGGVISFVGDGSGGIEMGEDAYRTSANVKIKHATSVDSTEWEVIPKTRLADMTAVAGSIYSGGNLETGSYFFENDGQTASVQFQAPIDLAAAGDKAGIIGGVVDFRQSGADILYRQRGICGYYNVNYNPGYETPGSFRFRITETGGTIFPISSTGANWASWWGIANLTMSFRSKVGSYEPYPEATLSVAGAMTTGTGARFVFGDDAGHPIKVTVDNGQAFANVDCVEVKSNATVITTKNGDSGTGYGLRGETWWILGPDAYVLSKGYFTLGSWQGMELGSGAVWEQTNASGSYLTRLTYHDGARTVGNVNLGQGGNPKIVVDGTSKPSVHDGKFAIYTYTSMTTEFNVSDVTGSPDTDFTVTGSLCEMVVGDASHNDMKFVKVGEGTLRLEGEIALTRYPFYLNAGTVEFGASGVTSEALDIAFQLGSPTLAVAADTTNAVGNVVITSSAATLSLGANAELDVASIADWTSGYPQTALNIVAAEGARLRIGTSAASVSPAMRARMRLNGKKVLLDAEGYVYEKPRLGLQILVR